MGNKYSLVAVVNNAYPSFETKKEQLFFFSRKERLSSFPRPAASQLPRGRITSVVLRQWPYFFIPCTYDLLVRILYLRIFSRWLQCRV